MTTFAIRLASEKGRPVERMLVRRRNGTLVEPGVNWQTPQMWMTRATAEQHAAEASRYPDLYTYEVVEIVGTDSTTFTWAVAPGSEA